MRTWYKRILERVLVHGGVERLAHAIGRPGPLVLAYHNIVPDGEDASGDLSLHLPQRRFTAQLEVLAEKYHVIPLKDLADDASRGARRRVAITFDDAYRGAVMAGVDELARRQLPATVFVVPGCVGDQVFWWDALADVGGLSERVRHHVLERCAGRNAAARRWAAESGIPIRDVPAHARTATQAELTTAVRHEGITLGSHSWSHPNLSLIGATELRQELESSRKWLQRWFAPTYVDWLAYPYGISSPVVQQAAAAAGYRAAVALSGARGTGAGSPFTMPRLNIPAGLSIDGFRLLMARVLR